MAIYHCSVKTVSRAKGGSAVASASYRSAEKLKDLKNEKTFDYTRKQSVDFKQIIGWSGDRESLWNTAELAEKRKDATTAREYEVALPCELSNDQKIELAVNYGNWLNERHGVAVDVCIHQIDSQNPHAHILTTTRESLGSELGDKVAREWSDTKRKANGLDGRRNDLIEAKAKWADLINTALERNHIDERVSHLSLAEQGIDREPQIHVGSASNEMVKRGEVSYLAAHNQKIIEMGKLDELSKHHRELLNREITKEFLSTATPSELFYVFKEYRDAVLEVDKIAGKYWSARFKGDTSEEVREKEERYNKVIEDLESTRDSLRYAREQKLTDQKVQKRGMRM